MLTEDYIMRMISQAIAVLMTALGLKKQGKFNEAIQSFDQAIEALLGLNAPLADQLDEQAVLELLTFNGVLDTQRLLVLADIYRERAEVEEALGRNDTSPLTSQRSLRLYLEAALAGEATPEVGLCQKIEALRQKINPATLPIETRLALLDYLERLSGADDRFLADVGVPRSTLEEAIADLNKLGMVGT